jgi:hypothetical protein
MEEDPSILSITQFLISFFSKRRRYLVSKEEREDGGRNGFGPVVPF